MGAVSVWEKRGKKIQKRTRSLSLKLVLWKFLRREKLKEQRKAKRAVHFTSNSSPGFDLDLFSQTDYYFENGLRKVYPYRFTFSTYAKERWYGRTLQDVFEREFRVDSPDNFRTSVAKGCMRVNGKVATLGHVMQNGDFIEHDIHRHENPVTGTPIEILEDNEDLVVINKPPSIPCHPCGKFRFNSIVFIMGKEHGYANLRNIYRLDRLTSGVLILGKTARKTKELENHVLHRRVHKEYVARVLGHFPPGEVTVDEPLDCLSHKLTLWRVVDKGGKPSRTTFHRLSYNGHTSVVKCLPYTGRTHQIRVHLQYLGHPIVNDPYYNSPAWGPQRGKGGHCDVSFEELCQRIMKEHNVGLWCDGENPLFEQRLTETRQSQQPSLNMEDSTTPVSDVCQGTATPAATDEGNGQSDTSAGAPPAKKLCLVSSLLSPPPRAESRDVAESSEEPRSTMPQTSTTSQASTMPQTSTSPASAPQSSVLHSPPPSQVPVTESAANPTTPETGTNSSETAVNSTTRETSTNSSETAVNSTTPETGTNSPSIHPTCVTGVSSTNCGLATDGAVERKGFDPERWVPDPQCESCRLRYIDPKPSDLLLYLHALRYKGPGWDYSTPLPEWAADQWQEPDDYSKYLH
ncbi:hypothetical protein ACOMHN_024005 [Nucella lapillus]